MRGAGLGRVLARQHRWLLARLAALPCTGATPPPPRLTGWAHQETFIRRALSVEARATDVLPAGATAIQRSASRCAEGGMG